MRAGMTGLDPPGFAARRAGQLPDESQIGWISYRFGGLVESAGGNGLKVRHVLILSAEYRYVKRYLTLRIRKRTISSDD